MGSKSSREQNSRKRNSTHASHEYKSIRRLLRQAGIHEEIDEKTDLLLRTYQTFLMLIADISSDGERREGYDLRIFTDDELARLREVGKIYIHILEKNWLRHESGL